MPLTSDSSLIPLGDDIWACKKWFNLGENQTEGLCWEGLRERFIQALQLTDLAHPEQARIFQTPNESPDVYLEEEIQMTRKLLKPDLYIPFPLDTTMTIVRIKNANGNPVSVLISPVSYDKDLASRIQEKAPIGVLVSNNLQHWLFISEWAAKFPNAKIYIPPAALGEDVREKLDSLKNPMIVLENGTQISSELHQRLLVGAPLNMNEMLFYHAKSRTLITSDGFYGGYRSVKDTTWFSRAWFKLTKGKFSCADLPIYRTSRVLSHGDKHALMRCVQSIVDDWEFEQIVSAHGSVPFKSDDSRASFEKAWSVVLK